MKYPPLLKLGLIMFIGAFHLLDSLAFWQAWFVSGACSTVNAAALKWHGYLWLDSCKGKGQSQD